MGVGEVRTDLPEPSVRVVDTLHRVGEQLHRLPRQGDRIVGPARASECADRGHHLPGLVGVGTGIGILDVPVLRERRDTQQITDTGSDRGEVPTSTRSPKLQTAPQLPVLADLFLHQCEQLVFGQTGQPPVKVLRTAPGRLPLPRQDLPLGEHGQAEGDQMLAEIALHAVRAVTLAGQPAWPVQRQLHLVPLRAVDTRGHPAVTDLDPGHRVQVAERPFEGARTGQRPQSRLPEPFQ